MKVFSWRIWALMLIVMPLIKRLARRRSIPVKVTWIGAVGIDPRHLAIWVKTDKDWERDLLKEDSSFKSDVIETLRRCRYPAAALPYVGLEIQSQQTVDRQSGGRWVLAMK